ncbi:MAG TPA: glycosyltransferase [bacterium]|nr:glycosyltransferase [bacterium]
MRITFLLEVADQLWGGVKVALEDANWLSQRGHQVTVVSRSGPPAWMPLDCAFQQVADFRPEHLPDGDVVVGTFWTTVPWAASAGPSKGVPVHFCQGYEGDNPEFEGVRERIESAYRLPGVHHLTISPHLTKLLRERFGIAATELRYAVDHAVHHPAPHRPPQSPLRVGLVGPWTVPWKDLPTGYAACELAAKAGQNLVLVRASNTPPSPEEQRTTFPVEWHQQLRPDEMGDFYRSLDVFLGTSSGAEEGFFLPAIEAMACGVPSVLTDIPCFRNHERLVGHDRYALFVEPRDPAAMAEALVLAGALPDVRAALRAGGIEVADHYRIDTHGAQLEAALQQFVGAGADLRLLPKRIPTPCDATPPAGDDLDRLRAELRQAGRRRLDGNQPGEAARLFAAARCLDEADEDLLHLTARAHVAAGDAARALELYDGELRRGRDDEHLHVGRGEALHALGRMTEAAQAFRAALAVGARTADNYNRLGVVLYQAGDIQAARQSFERALVLDPNHADARANLGSLPAA